MLNNVVKSMIIKGLNMRFPGFLNILIDVEKQTATVNFKNQKGEIVRDTVKVLPTDNKYMVMLAEARGMQFVSSIYVDSEKNALVIKGDKNEVI